MQVDGWWMWTHGLYKVLNTFNNSSKPMLDGNLLPSQIIEYFQQCK